jgi:glutamine amidotransferase
MLRIIDYGSGNLRSVQKAFERQGVAAEITADPNRVAEAERLVLPGVGAFSDAMAALRQRGLVEPIQQHLAADRPFLGICMGLQLLFETGWEGGRHDGLGLLAGEVVRFDLPAGFKVPHMGWNQVDWRAGSGLATAFAEAGEPRPHFYFVHSYHACPKDPEVVLAETDYHQPFCAGVMRGRLLATQFHPEKSQASGMRLLRYFLDHV